MIVNEQKFDLPLIGAAYTVLEINSITDKMGQGTVLPARSDSDLMFCL